MTQAFDDRLARELEQMREEGEYQEARHIQGRQSAVVELEEYGEVVNLCSNNYLGLCDEPEVMEGVKRGTERYGAGTSSVRFICGTFEIHRELEEKLADFMGTEAAVTYTSCWNANEGLFAPLLDEEDVIISDELNHASIIDGIRLASADLEIYGHMDMESLEETLRETQDYRTRFVITDGVFSMEGEIAPLPEMRELCDEYDAVLAIDDSHATGVLGETGRGTPEFHDMHGEVDVITSTLGKALGGMAGGYVAGSREVVDYLTQESRTQLFTNAMPPHSCAGALAAVEHLEENPGLLEKLHDNTRYFRRELEALGYDPIEGETPIVPVIVGETPDAIELSSRLLDHGAFVIGFGYPVVPKGTARIRCQISAAHEREHLDRTLDALETIGTDMGII
ncbi:MAG: glycine C-acetyltransferase [Candidatus Palauibacterales bacterium]|nr:glycine C-acetyltransferase [Candidatus Palauibacterales bacterium]